jgi:pimeloyl-ACP methyl ester carboxylesterase
MKQTTPTEEFPVEHISIHGHQIGYRRGGEGPVLLLLHGIAGSSLTWVPAMRLLQSDYTVLAPDFLGHRASEKALGDYSLGNLATVIRDLLNLLFGVGPETAASLLVAAGDNPGRLHSEAAWAHLCGVSPVPADSGKNAGHLRRHNGGDRQADSALWRIAMVRIAHDPETRAYFERRVKEGRTKRDIIRILQRYIAREVYHSRYLPRG